VSEDNKPLSHDDGLPGAIPDATAETATVDTGAAPVAGASVSAAPAFAARHEALLAEFAAEYLRDRRSDRRWRSFVRLAWLLALIVGAWMMFEQYRHVAPPNTPHTAMVEVRGEIAEDSEASAELILSAVRSAFEENSAQAVVLRINSPGGSPVQAGMIYDEIKRLKAKHGKKVYAVVEEICASGAYYIAASADEIYVDKASVVGSIGVLMDGFGFTGLMEKVGVERRLLTAGENKGMLDPFSPMNARQRGYAQSMLDQIHRQFIAVVREGRGKRLKETPEMFSGLFWNGEEAVKLGLADDFGSVDFVAREVVKAEDVIDYTPRDNVAERLAKRFGASFGASAVKALRSFSPIH